MAAILFLADEERERELKRMRVFRDRKNPLHWFDAFLGVEEKLKIG